MVQSSLHTLHSSASRLLLPAADVFPSHADGHAVLGVVLDRPQSRAGESASRFDNTYPHKGASSTRGTFSLVQLN